MLNFWTPSRAVYEHYSGKRYRVLSVGRHSESLDELVIYQAQYGEGDVWAQPLRMFIEEVEGRPRFRHLEEQP
ncbi:MAG: DUF1653 domain-containing protein [Chlamydiales bacterium]|nr:DUF1653 domain-containing protein [Chlamydiales bacterium]